MTKTMKKIPVALLVAVIAMAVAFAIGTVTAQEAHAAELSGSGTDQDPYKISNYEELNQFAKIVNDNEDYAAWAILTEDIYCTDRKWVPISDDGSYAGTFDGNHKVIYDLSNEETGAGKNNQGLFGKIVKGEVKNVGIVGGKIIGKDYVGAVVGQIIGTMTNCYNTGSVSGLGYVGGVAGKLVQGPGARATITNCYNTGSVSGSQGVGGLVGYNGSLIAGGTITNCYNVGSVSGSQYVGGVAGSNSGAINNCYYNKELNVVKAIGDGSAGTNVEGLETSQMIGTAAGNMDFRYESPSKSPWLTKEDGKDADSGTYYEYYPHLKGFAYDISKKAADWPGKMIVAADWSNDAASYNYNGSAQGPKVTKVISSPKPVEIPDDMTAEWRVKNVIDVNNSEWSGPIYDEPSLPGVYKLTIKDPKDGDKVIEEIVYIILKKKNSSYSNDYNVKYQVQKKTAGGGTKWSDIDPEIIVEPGKYKAVIQLTSGNVLEEKAFQIEPIPLKVTINGSSAKKTYNGKQQTYTGTVTVTSQDKAFDTAKFRYTGSTVVKGTKAGTYTTKLTAKDCAYSDSHYGLQVTVGSPIKLTITENKKPEPKPTPDPKPDPQPTGVSGTLLARMTADGKTGMTISWKKIRDAAGYDIFMSRCSWNGKKLLCKKVESIKGNETFKWTKTGLAKKTPYKVYVKAYVMKNGKKSYVRKSPLIHGYTGNGTKLFTNARSVTVNKTRVFLEKGKAFKIKAKVYKVRKGKTLMGKWHAPRLRYITSNSKVATVSSSGKIKARSEGTCYVYAYAHNGASKKIKVTVR